MPMPLAKSETTQNVAAGVAGTGLVSVGTIALLRQIAPDFVPWEPSLDEAAVTIITAVLSPLLSRWLAFKRAPHKKRRYGK